MSKAVKSSDKETYPDTITVFIYELLMSGISLRDLLLVS